MISPQVYGFPAQEVSMPPSKQPERHEQEQQPVPSTGVHSDQSLSQLLDVKEDDAASTELRQDLERIREAERTAERNAAAVRLY
jgi:hypothetical protein